MKLESKIYALWNETAKDKWDRYSNVSVMDFKGDASMPDFRIIHNTLRDAWEKRKAENTIDEKNKTRVNEKYIEYNKNGSNMLIYINKNPTLLYHLCIFAQDVHEEPTAEDHRTIISLVNETDYMIYLNLRGSGASLPNHLHYQAQKRENYPIASFDFSGLSVKDIAKKDEITVQSLPLPNYGIRFLFSKAEELFRVSYMLEAAHHIIKEQNLSYNLLFDKSCVYLFPRKRETVANIPWHLLGTGMDKWQIAGQEMGYLFTAKFKPILENITRHDLAYALQSVTVNDYEEREYITEKIIKAI